MLPISMSGVGFLAAGCGSEARVDGPVQVRINEVVSNNEGVWVDELGETDDYIELFNISAQPVSIAGLSIEDGSGVYPLPNRVLPAGEAMLLWADDDPKQGELHLPFKISSSGETLRLLQLSGNEVDRVDVPALSEHAAFARQPDGLGAFGVCDWATPARKNGSACGPSLPPAQHEQVVFAPYVWPEVWPAPSSPLVVRELALRPARFVRVTNTSPNRVTLADHTLHLAPHAPGAPLPGVDAGRALSWPVAQLEAGQDVLVPISAEDVAGLAATPRFQGMASVFANTGEASDRVEFADWPEGATLERDPLERTPPRFCAEKAQPSDTCQPLAKRPLRSHTNRLLTPGDFDALAYGRGDLGIDSVAFIVDMAAGDHVTFLSGADWDLHYSFVREVIQGLPHLDRCVAEQKAEFDRAWREFSELQYFQVEGRRYLLGTLARYAGNQLTTLEFSPGDVISAEQMKRAFFAVMRRVPDPRNWKIRPQTPDQIERARGVEGQVPLVGPNAAFEGVEFQPLSPGMGFGTLRFVPESLLREGGGEAGIGPRDIVITDQVPNDIPLIGGLITESFQTPLSHVNVLSRGRGTPNAALRDARQDPRVQPLLGELVRFEVRGGSFSLERADPVEAARFFEMQKPVERLVPRLDTSLRGIVALSDRSFADLPAIGGKAAQFAELSRVAFCSGARAPADGFAIPVSHYVEHFERSGARVLFESLLADPEFSSVPARRAQGLATLRDRIESTPLDAELEASLLPAVTQRFAGKSLRFRSSSNVEDLAGFNGAGLYTSVGVDTGADAPELSKAVRRVWASLWNERAYAERDYYNVDQTAVAMAVLVHEGFPSERANGVAISRNVLEPTRADIYYVNAQVGEALVTNPAPGVASDEFTYNPFGYQKFVYQQRSSFSPSRPVLSAEETYALACNLSAIHTAFRPFLDPQQKNPAFAVDIEFKLMGAARNLVVKQARAFSFGKSVPDTWCDF